MSFFTKSNKCNECVNLGYMKMPGTEKKKKLISYSEAPAKMVQLRASLCKILISSFAHEMDFAHNFSVDFF